MKELIKKERRTKKNVLNRMKERELFFHLLWSSSQQVFPREHQPGVNFILPEKKVDPFFLLIKLDTAGNVERENEKKKVYFYEILSILNCHIYETQSGSASGTPFRQRKKDQELSSRLVCFIDHTSVPGSRWTSTNCLFLLPVVITVSCKNYHSSFF